VRILGIDPGTEITGFGVVDASADGMRLDAVAFGEVRGDERRRPLPERLATLHGGLARVLQEALPSVVVVEGVFYAKNARSALTIGHARGVVLMAAAEHGIPVIEYAPPEVKRAVCGTGAARKLQVQFMVQRILSLPEPPPVDASDALALAICHARRTGIARAGADRASTARLDGARFGTARVVARRA
jgi:crossover junction endodeoxyribonuclease RuvC